MMFKKKFRQSAKHVSAGVKNTQ